MHGRLPPFIDEANNIDDALALLDRGELDALLHNIAGKLLCSKADQVPGDDRNDLVAVALPTVLDDVLGDIVTVLVDNQVGSADMKLVKDVRLGRLVTVFQHALDDPTAVWMRRQMVYLVGKGVDDERNVLSRDPLDSLLNHMITVLVLDAFQNLVLELLDQAGLLIDQDVLEGLTNLVSALWMGTTCLPFERPCIRTSAKKSPRCGPSSCPPAASFAVDCHAQKFSV